MTTEIQAPVFKAGMALGTGAVSSATSVMARADTFLPKDLAGWMAVAASGIACIYTGCLLAEWWWKKFWKPFLRKRGWRI